MKNKRIWPGSNIVVGMVMAILFLASCKPDRIEVINLKCEDQNEPIAIHYTNPLLSWNVKTQTTGFEQTAYRILVSSNQESLKKNGGTYWDSGKVMSSGSIYIPYTGKELSSREKLYWKVMVWDHKDEPSEWSKVSKWEMGLIDASDWKGKWIGTSEDQAPLSVKTHPAPYFRKSLELDKKVKKARVYLSGLGFYEFYLNGEKIGDQVLAPAQSNYDKRALPKLLYHYDDQSTTRIFYNTFDVTSKLNQGSNVAGMILGNGWYNQRDRIVEGILWYSTPRLIFQMEVEYEDGMREVFVSDDSWKTATGPIRHDGIFTGEIYDAQMELSGWSTTNYDDVNWENASIVRTPTGKLEAQMAPPDRIVREFNPIDVKELEDGTVLVDAGEMVSGWIRLRVREKEGTRISMRYFEEQGSSYGQKDVYVAKGGSVETWEPRFTWHAFRTIKIQGLSGVPNKEEIDIVVVNTDVERIGDFKCSNELFNRIQENYIRTQLGNFHGSISSDCPHRERLGYTGDGSILTQSSILNFDMTNFYRKWVNDMDDARNKITGFVPHTAPFGGGGGGPAWGSAYVITPWFYYLYYGDTRILREHYDGMKHWVTYLGTRTDERGIVVREEPRGWCLGDWATPEKIEIPPDYVNTCYYYYVSSLMAKIAHVLNQDDDHGYYSDLADSIKSTIRKYYYDQKTGQFWEGRQGANVFALAFGLVEENEIDRVLGNLVSNIDRNRGHLDTGILGTPLLLEVLTKYGRSDLAYTIMDQRDFPGYGDYILGKGATALWENWDGGSSHSHPMYGSVIRWFYNSLAGINPVEQESGFKHILFKPELCGDLSSVSASYESLHGKISSEWNLVGDNLFLKLQVPPNTKATLILPCTEPTKVLESGKKVEANTTIQLKEIAEGKAVYELSSGKYEFLSPQVKKLVREIRVSTPAIHTGGPLIQKPAKAQIEISSATPECKIFYTIDGSIPSKNSIPYNGPFELDSDVTIRAIATKTGYLDSYDRAENIMLVDPEVNGLHYKVFEGDWNDRPDMNEVQMVSTGKQLNLDVAAIEKREDYIAIEFSGYIKIENEGLYTFYSGANDGSWLYIDEQLVVDNTGDNHSGNQKGKIQLKEGYHPFRLIYYENSGTEALEVAMEGPGITKQSIPSNILFLEINTTL